MSPRTEDTHVGDSSIPSSPPSAFQPTHHKAKKRTSDEFERDQFGVLVSKTSGLSITGDREKDDRARRHRSLGLGSPSLKDRPRDRRRTDSTGSGLGSIKAASRHQHQASTSSVETRHIPPESSPHLPSSPLATTTVHATPSTAARSRLTAESSLSNLVNEDSLRRSTLSSNHHHSSPSVAHSLLRGTQEGWLAMDDSATAEALRKLDGISGNRPLRGRASVGSSRANSRPGTPPTRGGLTTAGWEGRDAAVLLPSTKDKPLPALERPEAVVEEDMPLARVPASTHHEIYHDAQSGDGEVFTPPPPPHTPSKHMSKDYASSNSIRSSYGIKRGSASSASATTGTPTTSSRDSITLSTTTSATSASALSHRHSGGKLRRSSGASDISAYSSEFNALKDRAASLANGGDEHDSDTARIPPVPPLPMEFQSPSSATFAIQHQSTNSPRSSPRTVINLDDPDRTFVIPTIDLQPTTPSRTPASASSSTRPRTEPSPGRVPTKKWSFSNALHLKSPGRDKDKDKDKESLKSPTTPRKSTKARQSTGSSQVSDSWSVVESPNSIQTHQLHPAASSASLKPSDAGSSITPTTSITSNRSPERSVSSRTSSSASTQTTSQARAANVPPPLPSARASTSKRLTPSNIPFFRRSSSSSMKVSPSAVVPSLESPPLPPFHPHHASNASVSTTASKSTNSLDLMSPTSPTSPGVPQASRKASVLSLLKGSASRKSMVVEKPQPEIVRMKDERDSQDDSSGQQSSQPAKSKKDDKERSESRISILMGRKRGKVRAYLPALFTL